MIAISLAKGETEHLVQPSKADTRYETDSDSSFELQASVESEGSSRPLKTHSLKVYYDEFVSIVDQLFDLSILIRGVSRNFRISRAAAHIEKDGDGTDALHEFKRIVSLRIVGLAQYAPEWLVDRLTDVIGMRRQQFYYQRAHKHRLSKFLTPLQEGMQHGSRAGVSVHFDSRDSTQEKEPMSNPATLAGPRTEKSKSTAKTNDTTATDLIVDENQTKISILPKPTKTEIAERILPGPPKEPYDKAFECPHCFIVLPATMRKEELWMLVPTFFLTDLEQKASPF